MLDMFNIYIKAIYNEHSCYIYINFIDYLSFYNFDRLLVVWLEWPISIKSNPREFGQTIEFACQ